MATALKDRLARQASGEAPSTIKTAFADEPRLVFVPLNCLEPDPNQPRKNLGDLTELTDSIREQGLIHPLVVEAVASGRYRIVAGERRFAACRQLGLETVPCLVRTVAEHARLALQLIENLHRQDLRPLEEARAFRRLMDEFSLTQDELAQRLGQSLTAVNQTLRLLTLGEGILAEVQTSEPVSKSLLLEIAKVTDVSTQQALWEKARAGKLTVHQARIQKQKCPGKRPQSASYSIKLPIATVTIRFQGKEATLDRVKAALEQALACHEHQTRSSPVT